ncbi:MAG: hypothetical protein MZV63_21900 [Marinilabiliales bacterium]|nr:hypothetical protein [Marinilabiliales bacterium]
MHGAMSTGPSRSSPAEVIPGSSLIFYEPADRDAMRVVADPDDESHFFVSSWGNGLYEFREGEVINNYNQYNSPLTSIRPGENYTTDMRPGI